METLMYSGMDVWQALVMVFVVSVLWLYSGDVEKMMKKRFVE